MPQSPKQILVLSSADIPVNLDINDSFISALNEQFHGEIVVSWANYDEIGYLFDNDTIKPFWIKDNQPLSTYEFVYVKSYYRHIEQVLTFIEFCKQDGIKFVCSELEQGISFSKLSQYARLTRAKLPIPKTLFIPAIHLADKYDYIANQLTSPFILKAIDGKGGGANFLIKSASEFENAVTNYPDQEFVLQSFIPNSSDLRIIILGDSIELIIKRQREDDTTHLNNTSQGGGATLVSATNLPDGAADIALQSARLFKREVAGVDLMFSDETGEPYILEVNASPQVASGAFIQEKVEKYGQYLRNMVQ